MILQRLAELYDRLVAAGEAKLPPPGYSLQKVSFCIVLEPDGTLHGFEDMRLQDGKQMRPRTLTVPGQGKPSGSGLTPCFLWDSPEYLLGVSLDPAKAERAPKAFAAFRAEHLKHEAKFDHPGFAAVCAFLRSWSPEAAAPHKLALAEYATNFGVFRLAGEQKFVHELVARPEELGEDAVSPVMCLVSGEQALPARLHEPKIKGVAGAQTAGALLVSFNAPAFTSYGKDQSFNAPVSRAAVFKYANALNHLLSDRKRRIGLGDATVVYWADRDSREGRATLGAMDALLGAFADEADEPPPEDRERLTEARLLLGHLRDGTAHAAPEPDGIPTRFFLLGLSPNASRLSVRFWVEADAPALTRRLGEHVRDLELSGARDERPLSIWRIATATGRCDAKTGKFDARTVSPQLAGELTRSVLTGAPYPRSLLAAMVRRIRADRGINHARVSAIKAVLARQARLHGRPQEVPVQLDPSLPDPAYRCGQLFALLEKAQTDALGDLNATIKDRYFASASATPALVFPRLFRLHQNHLAKLEPGSKVYYGRLMGEAMRAPFAFPPRLTLEEQGLFIVGYYQQQRSLYTKRDKPAHEEPAHA